MHRLQFELFEIYHGTFFELFSLVCGRDFRRKSQCVAHTKVHNNIRAFHCR